MFSAKKLNLFSLKRSQTKFSDNSMKIFSHRQKVFCASGKYFLCFYNLLNGCCFLTLLTTFVAKIYGIRWYTRESRRKFSSMTQVDTKLMLLIVWEILIYRSRVYQFKILNVIKRLIGKGQREELDILLNAKIRQICGKKRFKFFKANAMISNSKTRYDLPKRSSSKPHESQVCAPQT